jgi:DNA-binding NtrC family response regulator
LIPVNVRVIAATSRDLAQEIAAGRFRADLFYRLNVVTLSIPPLRERPDDLPQLCEVLADSIARQLGLPPFDIPVETVERLSRHDWPGNVRELANVLERALLRADGNRIAATDLEPILPAPKIRPTSSQTPALTEILADAERQAIRGALRACTGNKAQAAKQLGISRATLYEKLTVLGIDA